MVSLENQHEEESQLEGLMEGSEATWRDAYARLLAAISPEQRTLVERILNNRHNGGTGLREWVAAIARGATVLPEHIPAELLNVYLSDPEAVPFHDCEDCGLAVPIRPHRLAGMEAEPEQIYFPNCPLCGARTGQYFYWSRQAESSTITSSIRRRKPR
jgi:hypothetical protein